MTMHIGSTIHSHRAAYQSTFPSHVPILTPPNHTTPPHAGVERSGTPRSAAPDSRCESIFALLEWRQIYENALYWMKPREALIFVLVAALAMLLMAALAIPIGLGLLALVRTVADRWQLHIVTRGDEGWNVQQLCRLAGLAIAFGLLGLPAVQLGKVLRRRRRGG